MTAMYLVKLTVKRRNVNEGFAYDEIGGFGENGGMKRGGDSYGVLVLIMRFMLGK